jgi:hypothetical protein
MRISDWSSDVCSSDLPRRKDRDDRADRAGLHQPAQLPHLKKQRWISPSIQFHK